MAPRLDARQNRKPVPPSVSITVRMPLETRNELNEVAETEGRTLSNVVLLLVQQGLTNRKPTKQRKATK